MHGYRKGQIRVVFFYGVSDEKMFSLIESIIPASVAGRAGPVFKLRVPEGYEAAMVRRFQKEPAVITAERFED